MYKILVFTLFFYSCGHPHYKNPHVLIKTVRGDIELELFADQAPKTVAAFLSYVDSGYYNKTSFYRVLKDENLPAGNNFGVIQGGLWQTNPNKLITIAGIEHETTRQTGLSHLSGTVSLARAAPGTANTEFFICIGDQTQFDFGKNGTADRQGFSAFGKVFDGMKVARDIQSQKSYGDKFDNQIEIMEITRL
ncbi:MAG: peptidylprolyl isomerase [Ferruginibacter sp.]